MIYLPFRKEDMDKYRIFFQRGFTSGHQGTDWGMNSGTPLIAVEDGIIVLNTKDQYGGLFTRLLGNSGKQYEYVHLSKYGVNPNTKVKAGQIVGYAGATGNATGPHLHLNYYTKPGAGRSNFMSLNPTYFNYNPLPPMANRNDVYNLYKASIDKHKALAAQVRPDVAKAYGENFYWEHFVGYSNEYFEQIIRMRQLETENKLLTGSRDAISNARPGFDALYKYLHSVGIRKDIYEHILKGGDSALWTLVHGQKDIKTIIEGIVKERDALKVENEKLKAGNDVVKALDRINETLKTKS